LAGWARVTAQRKRGRLADEQADLAMLLDWSAENDADLFSRLVASVIDTISEDMSRNRWREPLEQAAAMGPAIGRVRTKVRLAAAVAARTRGDRIASARAALGDRAADRAYAGGRERAVEQVVELLLSYGASVGARA
jgi:hypothetical protein